MTGIVLGGIGTVVFAIFIGLLAGVVKSRQKDRNQEKNGNQEYQDLYSKYQQLEHKLKVTEQNKRNDDEQVVEKLGEVAKELQEERKKLELANMTIASLRTEIGKLSLSSKTHATELTDHAIKRYDRLTERVVKRYDNGKFIGETAYKFDEAGNVVEVKSNYKDNMSQENMLWLELDHLNKMAQDSNSAQRYQIARDRFRRPQQPKKEWSPSSTSKVDRGDWVHWKTKAGTKSKRPSPVLKTRTGHSSQKQMLLTYISNDGLVQFWCDADRCEKTPKPDVFVALTNEDIIQLCTKKRTNGKTPVQKEDFVAKLKGLYNPTKSKKRIQDMAGKYPNFVAYSVKPN